MKPILYYVRILSVLGCACCISQPGQAKDKSLKSNVLRLEYTNMKTERSGGGETLTVSFDVASTLRLGSQEIVYVYPSLVSFDGKIKREFAPLCISGKKRYRAVMRKKHLDGDMGTLPSVEKVYKFGSFKKSGTSFQETIPFERWMASGHLSLREEIYGCAKCGKGINESDIPVAELKLFGPADYEYIFYTPEKVEIKCYEEEFDCKVTFKSAGHELLPDFGENREELTRLDKFISKGLQIKGAKLHEIHITGYASPEGGFIYNKHLAERRTHTLSYHILSKYPQLKKAPVYEAEGAGEDWQGLTDAIKASSMAYKDEILSAIQKYDTDVEREATIRSLGGGTVYAELLATVYPALRRTTFRMKFDVRPYTDEELEEVFATVPGCLSQYEMYKLAQQNVKCGKSPVGVYRKAYEQFALDPLAALNYASALLKYEKDADRALQILETVKSDSRSVYPMAVAYDMKGDWQKAEELLKEAWNLGDERAKDFQNGNNDK